MAVAAASTEALSAFIDRWSESGGAERANYSQFLSELCRVLGVPEPDPTRPDDTLNSYVLERNVYEPHEMGRDSVRRIDLYRRGCFVLEAKQGVEQEVKKEAVVRAAAGGKGTKLKKGHGRRDTKGWDTLMRRAREQAEGYVRLLPPSEGRPPFVLVVDVGHAIEVYAEFTRTGGHYLPFPAAGQHRIRMSDLHRPEIRERLRAIWLDPMSLDPSRHAARVTRQVAATLAELSRSMEGLPDGQGGTLTPERVSAFLMRMIFTMFAEDVGLIGEQKFRTALKNMRSNLSAFVPTVQELWAAMATGGFSVALQEQIKRFNGGLFKDVEVLSVTATQLELLIVAAEHDWSQVEPSIFGTLVERALDPVERHRLGAHYTPRAYVERLVNQVVMQPLREDWRNAQVEIQHALNTAETAEEQAAARLKARDTLQAFLGHLQAQSVLDPACGTGNFLYVAMELIKRLEAEVLATLDDLDGTPPLTDVGPQQFLGLEVNPRAARVAELVLWIGYLQLYARAHGGAGPAEPILKAYGNIRNRDAVLAWRATKPHLSNEGRPVTRWDGQSTITDPVTGREIPDPEARVQDTVYEGVSKPIWPTTEFIVGNPPFIGAGPMREALGDGYVEALRSTYKGSKREPGVPDSADFVMYWWHKAVTQMASHQKVRRFGFVTTNSVKQTFNRRVIEEQLNASVQAARPLSLVYAVPDHPWVDEANGAAVRIAMTVVARGRREGVLERVAREVTGQNGEYDVEMDLFTGRINPDLTVGADVTRAVELEAMNRLSSPGVKLHGSGFIVPRVVAPNSTTGVKETDAAALGLGRIPGLEGYIREYRNGRDLTSRPRDVMVIDLFGLTEAEIRERYPELYQHVRLRVKPERDANNRASYRDNWWIFGEPRKDFRPALAGLSRYIATVETSKHRFFQFLDAEVLPDNMLVNIAHDDAYVLGVLSSRTHVVWALAQGGTLEDRPRYNKSRCFETFPFPVATPEQQAAIREKAEALDAHRKARLEAHSDLTMTGMYNVLEKLRAGTPLDAKEQKILGDGVVTVLRELHDELDALVQEAYGWEGALTEQEILTQLADLNAERALEERQGIVRYLRPEYQNPGGTTVQDLGLALPIAASSNETRPTFPRKLPEQVQAVRDQLRVAGRPLSPLALTKQFRGVKVDTMNEIIDTLVMLGQIRQINAGTLEYAT